MTNPSTSSADLVATLMAERVRYESWIAALETRRGATPTHIYDRVYDDYRSRLQRVVEQLLAHMADIEAATRSLTERLAAIERDETRLRDERFEAEVRSSVGELGQEAAQDIIRRTEDTAGRLAAERQVASAELARLREVLQLAATRRGGATTPSGPAAPARPPVRTDGGAAFNELEFLKSVVDTRGRPSRPTPGMVPDQQPMPAPPTPAPATPAGSSATDILHSQRDETGQVPAFLKDVPPEQVKTLKCQECGAMNYPTEWYCERCGAELAAL